MIQYRRLKRNLIKLNTRYVDLKQNSADFFNVTFMPEVFTSGKNTFKFKPNYDNISQSHPIIIEVLDSNGNNIFHHITELQDEDGSNIVSVYVYSTTDIGDGTVTFVGTSKVDTSLNKLNRNDIAENNIKYIHRMNVDPFAIADAHGVAANLCCSGCQRNLHEQDAHDCCEEKIPRTETFHHGWSSCSCSPCCWY